MAIAQRAPVPLAQHVVAVSAATDRIRIHPIRIRLTRRHGATAVVEVADQVAVQGHVGRVQARP